MEFRIGDKIRFKHDASEIAVLVVRATLGHAGLLCVSECGKRVAWAQPEEVDLDHRPGPAANEEIQKAIREVLLSDEFLAAFAAAWLKTPILHESELNLTVSDETRPYKSWNEIIKEAFQPITTAEVISDATLEPITGSESEAYYLNKLKNGESN